MGKYTGVFDEGKEKFKRQYADILKQLKVLSDTEIKLIVPQGTKSEDYKKLIAIVEDAAKKNLSQAQLISQIKTLGDNVVKIAKKIPEFATLL